jgi:putative membrane protein
MSDGSTFRSARRRSLIYLAIIILFAASVIIFTLQNFAIITVSFLGVGVSAPIAILVFVVYVLGAATGSSLFALLRRSYHGSRMPLADLKGASFVRNICFPPQTNH